MTEKWDRSTMRFASIGYLKRQRMIAVTFENGDHFLIAVESLAPATACRWIEMRIGETRDVIEVPANGEIIEIPWDRIRALTDPDYRAHLALCANKRDRSIGARLRTMRLEAGLSRTEIAQRVGATRETIALLETGGAEPRLDLVEKVAAAFGKTWSDFAEASKSGRRRTVHAAR